MTKPLPTYAISHGGGPWPWIKDEMPGDWTVLEASLKAIPDEVGETPKAILMVSAHWEEAEFTVQTNPNPSMLFDYGGFPPFTFKLKYPAPGSPVLAKRVQQLLKGAGIKVKTDAKRGFDHGTFVPLAVSHPEAEIPVVQLSLKVGLDVETHLQLGRALRPLRSEGVLIIGSGYPSFHNLGLIGPGSVKPSRQFDAWLTKTLVDNRDQDRSTLLKKWESAPAARKSHSREEHLLPVMVAVGAAEDEPGFRQFHQERALDFVTSSGYRFGAAANG